MTAKRKRNAILAGFIILKFILQYVLISPEYELHRDEYLYLDQANHLAMGYMSVPPLTSWVSLLINVLGNGVFWVKFFPALFGALTILVVWKTIVALEGDLFALILGATCVLLSVLLRLNTLYQPNSLDVLCWTMLYFVLIKYIGTERQSWLFAGAIVFAIGFLNKYNIAFLIIGLLPPVLMTRQRALLVNRNFYGAALMALMLVLPNLIWQYNNQFPVFVHLNELADKQLVNVNRWDFLKAQLLFFAGGLFVILSGLYALWFYEPLAKYRIFFWSMIFTLAVFLFFKAKDYYAIGIYPVYIAFGSVYLSYLLRSGYGKYLRPVAIAVPVFAFIPLYNVAFPNRSPEFIVNHPERYESLGLLRWEDGKDHALPQDFADMLGWRELADKIDSIYESLPDPTKTLVLCDNYGQAGAINYYTRNRMHAVSFNADYIDWFDLDRAYTGLIRVKEYSARTTELAETSPYFQHSVIADSIVNPFAREYGTTIFVFTGARIDITARVKSEIESVQARRLHGNE